MKTFKHSGSFGDLIYSLPLVKHFGGGEFYIHLNQINWIGKHYYGSDPAPFHQGRLTKEDFNFMKEFMLAQDYITKFEILDKNHEISHNLDRFRPAFVKHPGNYVDIYSAVFGITDSTKQKEIRTTPWLSVPNQRSAGTGKTVVINRTTRWIPPEPPEQWDLWKNDGMDQCSVFIGLEDEYEKFKQQIGWNIPYQPVTSMLEMAEYIAGAEKFIGNQSVALSVAIGLGKEFYCELRRDLPIERNECYFPNQPNGNYF